MQLLHGDALEQLKLLEDNFVDSIITDPPAGIGFMSKGWDKDKGGREQWISWLSEIMVEAKRVLKPGGHALVWALPRTSHWTGMALEDAGFEIRDSVHHIFGSGFPKSHDVSKAIDRLKGIERNFVEKTRKDTGFRFQSGDSLSKPPSTDEAKQWEGWGTALKPAHEIWWLVRKPLAEKTVAENVLAWGCGGLNIAQSRITGPMGPDRALGKPRIDTDKYGKANPTLNPQSPLGRFPANLLFSHHEDCVEACREDCAVRGLDECSGFSKTPTSVTRNERKETGKYGDYGAVTTLCAGDSGGASRFFYCAKASKSDKGADNTHPTVKSTKLMEYLIKLITPPGGTVLDPFMGSGSTGVAAQRLGFDFIGIEKELEYFEIAAKRIGL